MLVPAFSISLVTVAASSGAAGAGLVWSALAIIAALSGLQIGFLAGAALRDRMTGPLASPAPVTLRAVR
ncbi:MAG: hypothetical protein HC900_04375 [Methylacidiphilales bacterium]|nr:hypothetical protein [Candidatus Methylacidiphilales bacterium]